MLWLGSRREVRYRRASTHIRNDVAPLANESELPLLWRRSFHIHYAISDGSTSALPIVDFQTVNIDR